MAISSAERTGQYYSQETMTGSDVSVDIFTSASFEARSTFIVNDAGVDVTVTPTPAGGALVVKHNEVMPLYGNVRSMTLNGASGTVRVFAFERSGMRAPITKLLVAPTAASVGEAELKVEALLTADADGRTRMADNYFNAATWLAKIDTNAIDLGNAACLLFFAADGMNLLFFKKLLAADCWDLKDADVLAAYKDDSLDNTWFEKVIDTDALNPVNAAQLNGWAANGFDKTFLEKVLAADAFDTPGGAARLAFATDFFDDTTINRAVADSALASAKLKDIVKAKITLGAEAADVRVATIQIVDSAGANVAAQVAVDVDIIGELAAAYKLDNIATGTQLGSAPLGQPRLAVLTDAAGAAVIDVTDVVGGSNATVYIRASIMDAYTAGDQDLLTQDNGILCVFN